MSRKKSILIVEDEIIIVQNIMEILCEAEFDVLGIISSGAEAI